MEKIKVVPDNDYDNVSLIKKFQNKFPSNSIFTYGGYLHGKLESEVGYDLASIIEGNLKFTEYKEFRIYYLKEGVYDVEVIGIDKPCTGFFWNTPGSSYPITRGLIVFNDDPEIEYARKKYKEKSLII